MISTLLVWIYIFLLTTLSGHLVFRVLESMHRGIVFPEPSIAELSVTGLTLLGIFLGFFSFFFKIGLAANLLIIAACLIYFLSARKSIVKDFKNQIDKFRQSPGAVKTLMFIYLILALIAAQSVPSISDTGLYHVQNINWISSFKVIPGLGNLHGRFAYNNHSFLNEAFFSLSFLMHDFFHLLNSYLYIILSLTLIILVYKKLNHDIWRVFLYAGLLILLQIYYLKAISSPTPDIFSLAGIWFIFIIYLERLTGENSSRIYWIPVLFMAFFMITVKLSAFPIALISILFLIEYDSLWWKKLLMILTSAIIVFIPFFIRNYILSGYLIYPFPSIDLFNPDWKIPVQYVNEMKTVISTHAQSLGWQQLPFSEWFPHWFVHLSTMFRIMSCYILISPVLITILISLSGNIRKHFRNELKIVLICFFAFLFWFINAPNFRFIYAFMFFYMLITCMIIASFFSEKFPVPERIRLNAEKLQYLFPKTVSVFLLLFSSYFFIKLNYKEIDRCMIYPAGFREVAYKTVQMNNFKLNIPVDSTYCWNIPLPSAPVQKNIGVTNIMLRGNDLENGFRALKK
jgi:hypothetical protein